jgi:hypothetical protein
MQNHTAALTGSIAALSCATLRAMGTDGQIARLVTLGMEAGKATLESGMLLAILDENRKAGTLKGVLRKHLRDKANLNADQVEDFVERLGHAYKCAVVVSAYVFTGNIADSDYFAGTVSWFIPVCAVENFMEKEKVAPEGRATVRGRIARILKSREAGTQAALDAIWKEMKDADKADADTGAEPQNEGTDQPEEPVLAHDDSAEVTALKLRIAELETQVAAEAEKVAGLETRIANANVAVRSLAEIAGTLIGNADENAIGLLPTDLIAGLPEVIREPLMQTFDARLAALTAPAEELAVA